MRVPRDTKRFRGNQKMPKSKHKLPKNRARSCHQRNEMLRELGFATYADYLCSPLWQSIRKSMLAKHKRCFRCGQVGPRQIHHHFYSKGNLSGQTEKGLYTLCRPCHEGLEMQDGQKVPLKRVEKAFRKMANRKEVKRRATGRKKMRKRDVRLANGWTETCASPSCKGLVKPGETHCGSCRGKIGSIVKQGRKEDSRWKEERR